MPVAGWSSPLVSEYDCSIRLAESVPRVGHSEGTVLLRRDFDPIGFAVVGGRGRGAGSGSRSGDGGNGHGGGLVVGRIRDEHSGHRIFLATQRGKVHLPEIFETRRGMHGFHNV